MAVIENRDVDVERDVVFGRGGSRELLCDIYRPAPAVAKQTTVIHLHGGGFRGGSKAGARLARPLTALGYTCVAGSYRLAPEAVWPAQIHDVKTCIRWARAHASDLGADPAKLVVLGYSAGARLALIAAGSQNAADLQGAGAQPGVGTELAACVAFYPPVNALPTTPVLAPDASEQVRRSFSPLEYVKPGFPPTLLLHGAADQTVPVEASITMYNALRDVHAPVELHVIEGVTHVFDAHEDLALASAQWIDLFLDRHVVNPRTYASTEPGR
jgi:acetyl esterase/lipase